MSKVKKTDIPNDTITYAKMQNASADNVILGNVSGAGEPVAELTAAQVAGIVDGELLIDEDNFASDLDTKAPTQQSTKAYVDTQIAANAPDVVKISSQTASSSASIDFTDLSSTYERYVVHFTTVVPATDGANLGVRTSTDNGSTFDSGASDYKTQLVYGFSTAGNGSAWTTSFAAIHSTLGVGSAANECISGTLEVFNPSAAAYTHMTTRWSLINATGNYYGGMAAMLRQQATAVDAIQFIFSTGNIASGTFTLYGYK